MELFLLQLTRFVVMQGGLTFNSLIVLDRIVQQKKIRLVGIIGSCPESVIEKIEELMRKMKEDGGTM